MKLNCITNPVACLVLFLQYFKILNMKRINSRLTFKLNEIRKSSRKKGLEYLSSPCKTERIGISMGQHDADMVERHAFLYFIPYVFYSFLHIPYILVKQFFIFFFSCYLFPLYFSIKPWKMYKGKTMKRQLK